MGGKEDRDRGRPMADDCPLSAREQTRNLVLFGATISLIYLASSSLYVGLVQAALLDQLGASKTRANLPTTLYFWAMPLTLLVAWFFNSVRQLRPVLVVGFVVAAVTEVGVVITLLLPAPEGVGRSPWVSDMVLI